jgi:segregation and condensation protein B
MSENAEQKEIDIDDLAMVTEALLFASAVPLPVEQIAQVYANVGGGPILSEERVTQAITLLNEQYETAGRAFRIEMWAGGYRLATVPAVAPYVEELLNRKQPRRLSRSLLETIAIIAYKQPVSKAEVDFVRGVDSDYTIRRLLELGLIDVAGRSESLGRPLLYGTTSLFLDQFGLHNLEALPRLREIEEMLNDPSFNQERAKLLFSEGVQLPALPENGTDSHD